MKLHKKNHRAGFTLIEFIIALVVAGFMAAMVYTFFGNALTQSSVPIARLQETTNLNMVMENIVADYNRLNKINLRYKWRSGNNYSVGTIVLPTDIEDNINSKVQNNGRYYRCIKAGTSGTSVPGWTVSLPTVTLPRPNAEAIIDNPGTDEVRWIEQGYVWKAATTYPKNAIVVPEINNGHFYEGPGSPNTFTSGATEPSWSTTTNDGSVTWTEVGTILSSSAFSDNLYTRLPAKGTKNIADTTYGKGYTVTQKDFIQFNPVYPSSTTFTQEDSTTPTENNILKVTIKNNDTSETLTQIFTIR